MAAATPVNFLGKQGLYSTALNTFDRNVTDAHTKLIDFCGNLAAAHTHPPRSSAVMRARGKEWHTCLIEQKKLISAFSKFEFDNYISKGQKKVDDLEAEKTVIAKKPANPIQAAELRRVQVQIDDANRELNETIIAFTKAQDDLSNYNREWQNAGSILCQLDIPTDPHSKRFFSHLILDPPELKTKKPSIFAQWKDAAAAVWSGTKETGRFLFVDHPMATTSAATGLLAFGILCTIQPGSDGWPAITIRALTNPQRAAFLSRTISQIASSSCQSIAQVLPEQITAPLSQFAENYQTTIQSHLPSIETTMQHVQDQALNCLHAASQYSQENLNHVMVAAGAISLFTGTKCAIRNIKTVCGSPLQTTKHVGQSALNCAKGVGRFAHGWLKHGYVTSPLVAAGAYRIVTEATGNRTYGTAAAVAVGFMHLGVSFLYDQVISPTKEEVKSTI